MEKHKEKSEFELILDLVKHWIRHWYYFVIGILVCGVIGGVYFKLKTPEYSTHAMVALRTEDGSNGLAGMSLMKTLGFAKSSPGSNVEDEAIIMGSHGPVKKIVKQLDLNKNYTLLKFWGCKKISLYNKTPISINYSETLTDTINAVIIADLSVKNEQVTVKMKINDDKIGKFKFEQLPASITTPYGVFTFEKTPYFGNYGKSFKLSTVVFGDDFQTEIYGARLDFEEERKSSDIIHMKMVDDNVSRAKDILNAAIQVHNEAHAKEKSMVGKHTLEFITNRLDEVSNELLAVDSEIQSFKEKYGITDPEIDAKGYMDQGSDLLPLIIKAQTQLEAIKLTDKYLSDPKNKYEQLPYVVMEGSEELMKAISEYNLELSERNEAFVSGKKPSPVTKSFDARLGVLRDNLVLALKNNKESMEIAVRNLKTKESELLGKMKNYPGMERIYLELRRTQEIKQAIFIFLQQKKEETMTTSITLNSKLRVIDEPYTLNKPVSPNLFKILLMVVFFGGVLLPISAISLKPYMQKKKKNK